MLATASAIAPQMPNRPDVPLANRRRFDLGPSTASGTAPSPDKYGLQEDLHMMLCTDNHGAAHATDTDMESGWAINLLEGKETEDTKARIPRCATASQTAPNPDNYHQNDDISLNSDTYHPEASHTTDTECEVAISEECKKPPLTRKDSVESKRFSEKTLALKLLFAEDISQSVIMGNTISFKTVWAKQCGRLSRLMHAKIREKIINLVILTVMGPPMRRIRTRSLGRHCWRGRRLRTRQLEFLDVQPPPKLHQTRTNTT
ncbi:hypothetical protein DPMN_103997 [Dreissena polymorpha]|uniref:Uncharacterized protein n=1 Tax=Dreissena polymorpha TaxID=45954 RepID=A0A9D4H6Y5_DREPO|nr:hypothetical protein DPMN_103997 [Dreissena polymorpha]